MTPWLVQQGVSRPWTSDAGHPRDAEQAAANPDDQARAAKAQRHRTRDRPHQKRWFWSAIISPEPEATPSTPSWWAAVMTSGCFSPGSGLSCRSFWGSSPRRCPYRARRSSPRLLAHDGKKRVFRGRLTAFAELFDAEEHGGLDQPPRNPIHGHPTRLKAV
jgi:hypothetical protein